jgi:hypothetical protein
LTEINNKRVALADVLYTNTDETFYVFDGLSKYFEHYKANSMVAVIELLRKDNWGFCGEVQRHDYSRVDMLVRDGEYIAIWEE